MKKKHIRRTLWLIASPFILFTILCVLVYLPPVQKYLVDAAARYASDATGMNISVGRISLSFPLNLVANEVNAESYGQDTLLHVGRLQVNVQLLPLFHRQVEVDGVSVRNVTVDSNDLIHGIRLRGRVGELFVASHGVELDPETAIINKVKLEDADLYLCMNDTAATDTTAADTVYWKFFLEDMDVRRLAFTLHIPADTLTLRTTLGRAALSGGTVDLHRGAYGAGRFLLEEGTLACDAGTGRCDTLSRGLDPLHWALTDVNVQLDSLWYCGREVRADLRRFTLREQSGLAVVSAEGRLASDSVRIDVPSFRVVTGNSDLELNARLDWDALLLERNGCLSARLRADVGKPDLLCLAGRQDETFVHRYPSEPLQVRAGIEGDLEQLRLLAFSVCLPGALSVEAEGELTHLMDTLRRGGDLRLSAEAKQLEFLPAWVPGVTIPYGTSLDGRFTLAGPRMATDLLLRQPGAQAQAPIDTVPITVSVNHDTVSLADGFRMEHAARLVARYDMSRQRYAAELAVNSLDLHRFLPQDSLYDLSARFRADGEGLDPFSAATRLQAHGSIDRFRYGSYDLSGVGLSASLERHRMEARLDVAGAALDMHATLDGVLKRTMVSGNLTVAMNKLDWLALRFSDQPLETSTSLSASFQSNWTDSHVLNASTAPIDFAANGKVWKGRHGLHLEAVLQPDSARASVRAGDLDIRAVAGGSLDRVSRCASVLGQQLAEQWAHKHIDLEGAKQYLPEVCLKIQSGADNPFCKFLSMRGVSFRRLFVDVDTSPVTGVNGKMHLYDLHTDSLQVDTIYFRALQDTTGLQFRSGIVSGPRSRQEAFDVSVEGNIGTTSGRLTVQYLNARRERGVYLGVSADLRRRGIRLRLLPEQPTLVYRPFTVNEDNYIFLADKGRVYANVRLYDDRGTGLSFYTNREDSTRLQDMTLELSRINLKEFRRILPYMPDVEGWIGTEAHYVDSGAETMLSADLRMDDFKYEGSALGNWELSAVYLPGEAKDHHVDGYIRHDDEEIVHLNGIYLPTEKGGSLSGDVELTHFPLRVLNPFIPDRMVELSGDMDGRLSMKGDPMKPVLNGELALDSVSMWMPDWSFRFRLDNDPVRVAGSKMVFKNFDIFTQGKNPFTVNGSVDFSDLEKMQVDLTMKAADYELLNAPRSKRAQMYGKMYVDFDAVLRGPVDGLVMRGNMNVLGKTDFTYVLKDSPLAVNDRLNDMVTFVNFNDTIEVPDVIRKPVTVNGIDIVMTMHVDEAVQARVDLVDDGSNYMLLEGGGDLSFQYTPRGDMLLNGRYSLISGELKYEIPVIPLKTFNIRNGSYVEWSGNPMNPQLNITATERVRATVGEQGQGSRMVGFDVGLALSQRLENLGLAFTLSAPEDASVQEQLNAMSAEERGKLAVTMLVTGMYMAEGNATGGFNVNNALNTFLQNEISNIAGKALDISVGMETVDNAGDGTKRTDYNFQFAKRFWNNRFRIIIGGTVSTGNTAQQDETFIDNVSIEYRLDNSGTRYVKVFHDKNYESVLEGEIIETGVGIVLRKKMSRLGELFIFKSKKKNQKTNEEDAL